MKILIVENDPGLRGSLAHMLHVFHNHDIHEESSLRDKDLLKFAHETHEQRFDLALVDGRAIDDSAEDDHSGEEFASQLCRLGTPAVLFTAFLPSATSIFERIRMGELTGVIAKVTPIDDLVACLQQFEFSRRCPNGFAKFESSNGMGEKGSLGLWLSLREGLVGSGELESLDLDEIAALYRSIISPCATQVQLKIMPGGHSGALMIRASVSSGDSHVSEKLAIKSGEREAIRSEAMRYDRFVGPLPDGVAAQLRWRAETPRLGALAYSWVGNSIEDGVPLGPRYSTTWSVLSWQRRRNAVSRLLSVALNPWYEIYRGGSADLNRHQLLLNHYVGRGGLWYLPIDCDRDLAPSLALKRDALGIESSDRMWIFSNGERLADPFAWAIRGEGSKLRFRRQSPIHGDMHVGNVFVLPDDSPRLIDFGRTASGHIFRDFAALETSLWLTCVRDDDFGLLQQAESIICEAKTLGEHLDYRRLGENTDLGEAIRIITDIRRAALDACGGASDNDCMEEYLFALVMHKLRYAMGIADEIKDEDKEHWERVRTHQALYGAAFAATAATNIRRSHLMVNDSRARVSESRA